MSTVSPTRFLPSIVFSFVISGSLLVAQTSSSSGSGGSSGTDVFFLDLGIVIEPTMGDEDVNRLVKAPPKKVQFFLDKEPSGSVFMASTRELKETLNRISERIEALENAFHAEVGTLREENTELRDMVSDLLAREPILPPAPLTEAPPSEETPGGDDDTEPSSLSVPGIETAGMGEEMESKTPAEAGWTEPESLLQPRVVGSVEPQGVEETHVETPVEIPAREGMDEERTFDKMKYMNAVFAYQREDYRAAIKYFSQLTPGVVDQVTRGNVLYWIADCYYQLGEYEEALGALAAIRPLLHSDKQDDAMVLTGLVYRQLGDETQAMEAFGSIIDEYPTSEYFKLAQMELRKSQR
ncbi:MAG: tol-pal system YbgF family protein [Fidelibacterota bacterium]